MLRSMTRGVSLLLAMAWLFAACSDGSRPSAQPGEEMRSDKARITEPQLQTGDLETLVAGNTGFAVAAYQQLRSTTGNLFFSPHSISLALAMTYAGARGQTAAEMASALQFDLPTDQLHPAFDYLDLALASRAQAAESDERPFVLSVVNQLFGLRGYPFVPAFLDTLAQYYGAGLRLMDFDREPDPCREEINTWVENETHDRIQDLLPQGSIDELTRLVLVNAIYFSAAWDSPFKLEDTVTADFHLLDGSTIQVPMMNQQVTLPGLQGSGFVAVELPYDGDQTSMVVILPDAGTFAAFETSLTQPVLNGILSGLSSKMVTLSLPKWTFTSDSLSLKTLLQALGMDMAFTTSADFTGMSETGELFVADVLHKAFVAVDEAGTEAAAATVVIMAGTSMPDPLTFTADRPFLYLIRDRVTGAILFLGRTVDPQG